MPTYEYHCSKCKSTYELRQGFDAATIHTCEECGRGTAKRVLHAPRVHFKGSGFYATDSRSKTSAVSDSEPSTAAKAGTASASPVAAKKEGKPASSSPEAAAAS